MRQKLIDRIKKMSFELGLDLQDQSPEEWETYSSNELMDTYRDLVVLQYQDSCENDVENDENRL
jgi:hypothetical protein